MSIRCHYEISFDITRFLHIPDAFCCAENMMLMAAELGISSCIVAGGEETFDSDIGASLLREWNIPEIYLSYT